MATVRPETNGVIITDDTGSQIFVSYSQVPKLLGDLRPFNPIVPNVPVNFGRIREALDHYNQSDESPQAGRKLANAVDGAIFSE